MPSRGVGVGFCRHHASSKHLVIKPFSWSKITAIRGATLVGQQTTSHRQPRERVTGSGSPQPSKEYGDVLEEQLRLLQRREMAPSRHFSPPGQVEARLDQGAQREGGFARERPRTP
jgi:hypothetical protein